MTRGPSAKSERNFLAKPAGHVLVPAAMIAALSMALVVGLELLGLLGPLNQGIARIVSRQGAENFPRQMAAGWLWLAAACCAFGLAAAMLGSPGHGRRTLLWLSAMVVLAAWAPVLSLAAHAPHIAAPWIATLWAGICALIYATNHRMACDGLTSRRSQHTSSSVAPTPTPLAPDDSR